MELVAKQPIRNKKRDARVASVYSRSLITRNISLPIVAIGKNIQETIELNIADHYEGKCIVEGFIKPGSSKVITYSAGIINRGFNIIFEVVFECEVCFPIEGMIISCVAKNVTKAGIRAESDNETPSPVIVFVAKDHHYNNNLFSEIKEGDTFNVKVIGQRFELNDKYVSIIGELMKPKFDYKSNKPSVKPRIVIEEG
jgi:DNA-directed RNA polymerase subunit E'/Rpb7